MANLVIDEASVAPVNETQYEARTYTVGADVKAGMVVKVDPATGAVSPMISTDAATTTMAGIALRTVKAGGAVTCLQRGTLYGVNVSALTNGTKVYPSDTPADVAGPPLVYGPGGISATAKAGAEVGVVMPLGSPARDGSATSSNADRMLWIDVTGTWV